MRYLSILMLTFLIMGCDTTRDLKVDDSTRSTKVNMYEQTTEFMVCSEYPDIYQIETVDKRPLPVQGEHEWIMDFYKALRYPPDSREKGIQGTVILELSIGIDGSIDTVGLIQKVAPDIDAAALEAFNKASLEGFLPAIFDGRPVKSKATVPLHFRLG